MSDKWVACARPRKLTERDRDLLPDEAFALPEARKFPLYVPQDGYAVPSPTHARAAKAFATRGLRQGTLSRRDFERVTKAADGLLRRCRG